MTTTAITTASDLPIATGSAPAAQSGRWNTRAAGLLYLLTFAASIPAWIMLSPILTDPGYIVGPGRDTQVLWACLLDVVTALAGVGTAVAVFPILRRVNESLALGFVFSRMVEAAVISIGVMALLAVVTMRQEHGASTADASALITTGQALVATRDWTFLFGPGVMACSNALLFGSMLYRSRLVPRVIPAIGLIGAPLLLTACLFNLFGHGEQGTGVSMLATLPIAVWELSIGFWMVFKGFRATR